MSDETGMLGFLAADVLILVVALCFPQVRAKLWQFVLNARTLYVETPLRLVTGRRKADPELIARLERDLLTCWDEAVPERAAGGLQWTEDDVVRATPAEVAKAIDDGLLVEMGFNPRGPLSRR